MSHIGDVCLSQNEHFSSSDSEIKIRISPQSPARAQHLKLIADVDISSNFDGKNIQAKDIGRDAIGFYTNIKYSLHHFEQYESLDAAWVLYHAE